MLKRVCLFGTLLALAAVAGVPNDWAARKAVEIEFVRIASGAFLMGCSQGDNECTEGEKPAHRVRISGNFEMAKYQVTEGQWKLIMGRLPKGEVFGDRHPVLVSWDDAQKFIKRMNSARDGYDYRLPTEAEWEFAARAGSAGPNPAEASDSTGVYGEFSRGTQSSFIITSITDRHGHPKMLCGSKSKQVPCPAPSEKLNRWSMGHMLGQTPEWVQDWMGQYAEDMQTDPTGPESGSLRVVRGTYQTSNPIPPGSLGPVVEKNLARVSFREGWRSDTDQLFSFRCVRTKSRSQADVQKR
jgi:formylglycine-generating enzyme required for sulfatase activity